jgi:type IV pilus assembly protein PilQ
VAIRDTIVISDYPERIEAIKEVINQIDIQPMQVLLEVTILEAKLNETTKFGIDFSSIDVPVAGLGDSGVSQGGFAPAGTDGLSIGIVQGHVEVFIRAIEDITDTTVLANPKILALNKQAGVMLIGERVGYVTTSQIGAEGATQQVEFLEGGTRLAFRPFVCDDGLIRMELQPKQSDPSIDSVTELPSEFTTEVTTNVMVRDGRTIVLGGLFKEKTSTGRGQVPLLGDTPLIGGLFRQTNDVSERTELIILITPHIIKNPEDADGAERLEDVKRLAYGARSKISWISRTKIAEDRYAKAVKLYEQGDKAAALCELNNPFNPKRNYLDADRLRERIIRETQPQNVSTIQRIMLDKIEKEESAKWFRR